MNSEDLLSVQMDMLLTICVAHVGLDVCEQFMDISDVIRDEDLMAQKSDSHLNGIDHRVFTSHSVHNIQKMVANMVPSAKSKWPSARELNLLKRRAKTNSKDQTKNWCDDGISEASCAQNMTSKGTCPDSVRYNKVIGHFTIDSIVCNVCFIYLFF